MFEFGRDLRRLFEKARDSADLGWLEVIGTSLVESEARQQSTTSGRVSCPHPHQACIRASLLWREHARRTGSTESLRRAESEARSASRHAVGEEQIVRAAIELSQALLLAFDLKGGLERLSQAEMLLKALPQPRRAGQADTIEGIQARLGARRAVIDGLPEKIQLACDNLEKAASLSKGQQGLSDIELRLEQASLSLEFGLLTRDLKRLDKVGRDLRLLVEEAPSEQRPLTRARALALCGMGMMALSALANDKTAQTQATSLLSAAIDQFTMDHSPLDWAAIQLMRAETPESLPLMTLVQVEALTEEQGLILGAEARNRRLDLEIREFEKAKDLPSLRNLEERIISRLRHMVADAPALDWVSNQIALAQIFLARVRLTGLHQTSVGLILIEAETTARELGAVNLAERARSLLPNPQPV